jgi:hypothetical protein
MRAGDKVKIRSKKWLSNQGKNIDGKIFYQEEKNPITVPMQKYAGREAEVTFVDEDDTFKLDVDTGGGTGGRSG